MFKHLRYIIACSCNDKAHHNLYFLDLRLRHNGRYVLNNQFYYNFNDDFNNDDDNDNHGGSDNAGKRF